MATATRFDGWYAWQEGLLENFFTLATNAVVVRKNEIVIEWAGEDGEACLTTLRIMDDGLCEGSSIWAPGKTYEETARVEASLYTNETGKCLIGKEYWSENPDWFVLQLYNAQTVD